MIPEKECRLTAPELGSRIRQVLSHRFPGTNWAKSGEAQRMIEKIPAENRPSTDRAMANLHLDCIDPSSLNEALVFSGASPEENPSCETEGRRAHKVMALLRRWRAESPAAVARRNELELHTEASRLHVVDLHETVLHAMGIFPRDSTTCT